MRRLLALGLLATGCTDVPASGPHYDSVRDRLSETSISLFVRDEASSGAVTTRRLAHDGWIDGTKNLTIERGYVRASLTPRGQLEIEQLEIEIAPLALDNMFDRPAQLQNLVLRLAAPVRGDVVWTSDDDATATLGMAFDFGGALAFAEDEPFPLATQHLLPESVELVLTGSDGDVAASMDLAPGGELWNWSDLVQLTELAVSVTAKTVY